MTPRTLIALLAAATVIGGCIEANRPLPAAATTDTDTTTVSDSDAGGDGDVPSDSVASDTSATDTTATPCGGDGECQPLVAGEICKTARCAEQTCVVELVADDTSCGGESSCDGQWWSAEASCQAGVCVAPGPVGCVAAPGGCEEVSCDPVRGCVSAPKEEGSACVAGAGSLTCDDGVWHPQDTCDDAGVCVDAASQPCAAGFCEVAVCDPQNGCGVQDVGISVDAVATWRFVYFRFVPDASALGREVFGARGALSLNEEGEWSRGDVEASAVGAMPATIGGNFCAGDDGGLTMSFGHDGADPNALLGQLTPNGALFFAVSDRRPELMVAVKAPTAVASTEPAAARYHMLGLVKKLVTADVYSIDGVLSFGADGCLDRPATYQRSGQEGDVTIAAAGACLEFSADGHVSFPHHESVGSAAGAPVTFSGFTLPSRDAMVMAVDGGDVFPSLILFVREGADLDTGALEGSYVFGGLEAVGENLDHIAGRLDYDGQGVVTKYDAILGDMFVSGGGGPQDRYTVAVSSSGETGDLAGSYTHDVAVGGPRDKRRGQVAPRIGSGGGSAGLSPIVVHVPASSAWSIEPGLQLSIRRQ